MKKKIYLAVLLLASVPFFNSCKKEIREPQVQEETTAESEESTQARHGHDHSQETDDYSSEVVTKWLAMQLEMLRIPLAPGTGSQAAERAQAYCGIALYESVVPGMDDYRSLQGQLTAFPSMPSIETNKSYHWAASANAALAEMNRKLFPTTSLAFKTKMDSLENALKNVFATQVGPNTLQRSIAFGKEIATRVFAWAATDGSANVNPPYIAPAPTALTPWYWIPTSPAPAPAVNPYASQRRLLVPGVANGTALPPPPTYSTVVGSPFWKMAKDVYDKRNNATPDQQASAIYHRDVPGYSPGGNFVAILYQTLMKAHPKLGVAALAYAKLGIAQSDATIICFTDKYIFNLVRPVTYINQYIDPAWTTFIAVPNHPEFPSGHATINSAATTMLANVFGPNFQLTLHTYDYLGYPPRSYNSWTQMSIEMSNSRVFGGLHYQATCDKSRVQGKKVAQNVLNKLKFLKDNHHHDGHDGHGHH
jgi:membrane-associated phospholipid phosphatase